MYVYNIYIYFIMSRDSEFSFNPEVSEFIPRSFNPYATEFVPESLNPVSNAAATKIQSLERGRQARSLSKKNKSAKSIKTSQAATKIQSLARGRQSRKKSQRKKDAATRIQSLTRGRQSRRKTEKHKEFMKTFDDTIDPHLKRKIFYTTALGDDIEDRQDSIDDLLRNKRDEVRTQQEMIRTFVENPRYGKLEDTGLFKIDEGKFVTRDGELVDVNSMRFHRDIARRGQTLEEAQDELMETGVPMIIPDYNPLDSVSDDKKYLTEWYKTEAAKLDEKRDYIEELDRQGMQKRAELNKIRELDFMKCRKIREHLDAYPMLYQDPSVKIFSDECRNDMTRILVDSFFKLTWRLISPHGGGQTITGKINRFPNSKFTQGAKNALIDTLKDEGLLLETQMGSRARTTLNRFDLLAFYFKFSQGRRLGIRIRHLPGEPRILDQMDGYTHLNRVLDLFEDTINDPRRRIRDNSPDKIERMKRYFVYSLIGLDFPEDYKYRLEQKIITLNHHIDNIDASILLIERKIDILNRIVSEQEVSDREIDEGLRNVIQHNRIGPALETLDASLSDTRKLKKKSDNELKEVKEMLEYVEKYAIPDFNR